ncbi:hypothetical protein CF161_06941 [Pseudomonas sp. CF161]|nr:hypothetical protein CF161_06941 [Pseudomonas sp. CF161]
MTRYMGAENTSGAVPNIIAPTMIDTSDRTADSAHHQNSLEPILASFLRIPALFNRFTKKEGTLAFPVSIVITQGWE